MKIIYIISLTVFTNLNLQSQTTIKGRVTDTKGGILIGANVFIKNSYDGGTVNIEGNYTFKTRQKGKKQLIASYMGFNETQTEIEILNDTLIVPIIMTEKNTELNTVVITAGSFEASDKKKSVVMKSLDIYTTPCSMGDTYSALSSLPGAQKVADDGRLFVRGGEYYETKTFIDGLLVQRPFGTKIPDVPSRGRFSPQLFSGTIFNTGGYSAEYGQALSSAVILDTKGVEEGDNTSYSIMTVGLGLSHTLALKNSSLTLNADYTNLSPYFSTVKQNVDWIKAPESGSGSAIYRLKTGEYGMLKVYGSFSRSAVGLYYPSFDTIGKNQRLRINSNNFYLNTSYSNQLSSSTRIKTGISVENNEDITHIGSINVNEPLTSTDARIAFSTSITDNWTLKYGGSNNFNNYSLGYKNTGDTNKVSLSMDDYISATYIESEHQILHKWALRVGGRYEYASLIDKYNVAPRLSVAYKTSKQSQVSLAYGAFYEMPQDEQLRFNHKLDFENATHYIANYQWSDNDYTFRIEAYYKQYDNLVKYTTINSNVYSNLYNGGKGFAKGVDFFWRDRKSLKDVDYWISYSFVDTRRNYHDYPKSAVPTYVSKHNLNIVGKKYVETLKMQFGFSFTYASGRTYFNPNNPSFLSDRTRDYFDLSLNASYLTSIFKKFTVIHFAINNVTGRDNIFGYHYYSTPGVDGTYHAAPVQSNSKRFAMLGIFISMF
jgi:vitamin B12 transporter